MSTGCGWTYVPARLAFGEGAPGDIKRRRVELARIAAPPPGGGALVANVVDGLRAIASNSPIGAV